MIDEDITLVGYWNGDLDSWELSKTPQDSKDILVVLSLEVVPKRDKEPVAELKKSLKKLPRELRNLVRDVKKWSK